MAANALRSRARYRTPYFYFDPSDPLSLNRLNEFMERAEHEMAAHSAKHTASHASSQARTAHRSPATGSGAQSGRRFALGFPGNLPPRSVDVLIERLPTYFPYTVPYNSGIFLRPASPATGSATVVNHSSSSATTALPPAAHNGAGAATGGGRSAEHSAEAGANAEAAVLAASAASLPPGLDATLPVELPGTFSAYFQRLHAIHQMVLVGGGAIAGGSGPCTPSERHGFPERLSLGCLPLGPSHAFYDHLLRRWMNRHGRAAACALSSDVEDVPPEACIPFLLPLTRLKDLCDERRREWHEYA